MKTFREVLSERGLTPSSVAKETGFPLVTVAKQYYGMRKVSAEYAVKYEQALGIPRWEIRPDLWIPPHQDA